MIALSCCEKTLEENLRIIDENREYIGCAEIRVDYLQPAEYPKLAAFPAEAGLPLILTFRLGCDGGAASPASEAGRLDVLESALSGGYGWIDIEDDAPGGYVRRLSLAAATAGTKIIRSFHDFSGVPDGLAERMIAAGDGGKCIPKAAVMCRDTADMISLLKTARRLTDSPDGRSAAAAGFILLGMGSCGVPTRILASAFGSMLTFASAPGSSAAPGHFTPELLQTVYRYSSITRGSRIYGICGKPVMHSTSPGLHNGWYDGCGDAEVKNSVYLPFETDDPGILLKEAGFLNLGGLSVTIPNKQTALRLAGRRDEAASAVGAANTLVYDEDEELWTAYNTDWEGFLAPLEQFSLEGRDAVVIGAGGAARAVVYALIRSGMNVLIANRSPERAEKLADDFGCDACGFDDLRTAAAKKPPFLIVQTSSAGMSPDTDVEAVPGLPLAGVEIVYDIIYTPEKTKFLRRAEQAGCRIINGYPMLRAQAERQFELFTGCKASS